MTTFFGLWKVQTSIQPQDPRAAIQLYQAFGAQIKRDLETGDLKESHSFLNGDAGYFVTGDISEERVHQIILRYTPYVSFEIHETVPVLKTIENLIAISKERAAMMTVPA